MDKDILDQYEIDQNEAFELYHDRYEGDEATKKPQGAAAYRRVGECGTSTKY